MTRENTNSNKLNSLREREIALRAKIADEVKREQRRQWRNLDRLRTIVGGALVRMAEQNPDFKRMLIQSLHGTELTPAERAFLKGQGWQ
jgi:hypothetical protein